MTAQNSHHCMHTPSTPNKQSKLRELQQGRGVTEVPTRHTSYISNGHRVAPTRLLLRFKIRANWAGPFVFARQQIRDNDLLSKRPLPMKFFRPAPCVRRKVVFDLSALAPQIHRCQGCILAFLEVPNNICGNRWWSTVSYCGTCSTESESGFPYVDRTQYRCGL